MDMSARITTGRTQESMRVARYTAIRFNFIEFSIRGFQDRKTSKINVDSAGAGAKIFR